MGLGLTIVQRHQHAEKIENGQRQYIVLLEPCFRFEHKWRAYAVREDSGEQK
jgi:hypothetical protein